MVGKTILERKIDVGMSLLALDSDASVTSV